MIFKPSIFKRFLFPSVSSTTCLRNYSVQSPKACIVGSGPAAFSVAQSLLKYNKNVQLDMFEKLPVPFGLVRYGVAPDHQDVKNCTNGYHRVAESERFSFFGNVEVGKDVHLDTLCSNYHAVVLCHGAQGERKLNLEGEDYLNSFTSSQFVGWYNGVPEYQELDINLEGKTAVVIGIGNVALDCARMLLKPTSMLGDTDITSSALNKLQGSAINDVHVVGRRGPLQMACSRKELSEICDLSGVDTITDHSYFTDNVKKALKKRNLSQRKFQRLTKYYMKVARDITSNPKPKSLKTFNVHLLLRPVRILSNNDSHVSGVEFQKVIMADDGDPYNPSFISTNDFVSIDCDLLISCIGYNQTPLDSRYLTYRHGGNLVHDMGVVNRTVGLYACGWCSNGPVGVLADTSNSGHDVAGIVLSDLNTLMQNKGNCPGITGVVSELEAHHQFVNWDNWKAIDKHEVKKGSLMGKVRDKVVNVNEMLSVSCGQEKPL